MSVLDERMYREELDRRNAEVVQVLHYRCRREAGERAAHRLPDLRVAHRIPLDVQFVDYGFVPRMLIWPPSQVKAESTTRHFGTSDALSRSSKDKSSASSPTL